MLLLKIKQRILRPVNNIIRICLPKEYELLNACENSHLRLNFLLSDKSDVLRKGVLINERVQDKNSPVASHNAQGDYYFCIDSLR